MNEIREFPLILIPASNKRLPNENLTKTLTYDPNCSHLPSPKLQHCILQKASMAFSRPLKDLLRVFRRPWKAFTGLQRLLNRLSKALERPFQGHLRAFWRTLKAFYRSLKGIRRYSEVLVKALFKGCLKAFKDLYPEDHWRPWNTFKCRFKAPKKLLKGH